jgi:hypothetical protein
MLNITQLFDRLWAQYALQNPHAREIHDLLDERGDTILNDHVAFRTFDDPRINIQVLARPFIEAGYEVGGQYTFAQKKLDAQHYQHPDPNLPKVFISQLQTAAFSPQLTGQVKKLVDQILPEQLDRQDLPAAGRLWDLSFGEYEALVAESEYAGWLAAFGFCANHFTVSINSLESFDNLTSFNDFILKHGFELNSSGGLIKGSPQELLEQSSTLAGRVEVKFSDGLHTIPGCYYEFARRHRGPDGQLFGGFIAKSADKIFESTDRR